MARQRQPRVQDDEDAGKSGGPAFDATAERERQEARASAPSPREPDDDEGDHGSPYDGPGSRRPPQTSANHDDDLPPRLDKEGAFHRADDEDIWNTDWTPPEHLEAPPPRHGMAQRWIRFDTRQGVDGANIQRKMREGWRPRAPDTVPAGYYPPTLEHGQFGSCIGVDGLILCEMPEWRVRQRQHHYDSITESATEAIDADLLKAQAGQRTPIDRHAKTRVTTRARRTEPAEAGED